MRFTVIIALIIVVIVAFFAMQNSQLIQIDFLLWSFEGPLVIVLLITFAAGILSGWLTAIPSTMKKSRQVAELKRELKKQPPENLPRSGDGGS
jgi:uncharacterized integral membrane protein